MKGRTLSPILHGVVLLLLPFGCATLTEPQSQNSLLLRLAAAGTAEQVLDAIRNGAEANAKDEGSGWTPLLYAARLNRKPEVVSALLKAGADIDARTQGGLTALMEASGYNPNPEVVSALLLAGADIDTRYKNGETVLMLAAGLNKHPRIVSALLGAGADILARDEDGQTALMYAATYNANPEVATLLLKAGVDVDAQDNGGCTALIDAAHYSENPEQIISVPLRAGADPKVRNAAGLTAFTVPPRIRSLSKDSEVYRMLEAAAESAAR